MRWFLHYKVMVSLSSPQLMSGADEFCGPLSAQEQSKRLQISDAAAALFTQSDVLDLHVESYSFYRSFGYDFRRAHDDFFSRGIVLGQADLPRLIETGVKGATWVITANPLRPEAQRAEVFLRMLEELKGMLCETHLTKSGELRARASIVRNCQEYQQARQAGLHAAFIGIQGANALPADPTFLSSIAPDVLRITLLHMTDSTFGISSAPGLRWGKNKGLSQLARDFIAEMNRLRIFVDLAHIKEECFWQAVEAHDPSLPLIVTHTGVRGAHDHWRNLSDEQLRAVADSGGVVGLMYHSAYLGDALFSGKISSVVRHIQHTLRIIGDEHVALGSDWDGAICTPRDMPTCRELPRLVDALLLAGVKEDSVRKILGQNFLRCVAELRS